MVRGSLVTDGGALPGAAAFRALIGAGCSLALTLASSSIHLSHYIGSSTHLFEEGGAKGCTWTVVSLRVVLQAGFFQFRLTTVRCCFLAVLVLLTFALIPRKYIRAKN